MLCAVLDSEIITVTKAGQRETMRCTSSGPVTTALPVFPAHLSILAVPRMCQLLTGL